jgi:hypothetical protein
VGPVPYIYGFKIIERDVLHGYITIGVISGHITRPLKDITQRGHVRHDFLLSKLLSWLLVSRLLGSLDQNILIFDVAS